MKEAWPQPRPKSRTDQEVNRGTGKVFPRIRNRSSSWAIFLQVARYIVNSRTVRLPRIRKKVATVG